MHSNFPYKKAYIYIKKEKFEVIGGLIIASIIYKQTFDENNFVNGFLIGRVSAYYYNLRNRGKCRYEVNELFLRVKLTWTDQKEESDCN